MHWLAPVLLLMASDTLEVALEPLAGAPRTGTLVSLDSRQVVIDADGQRHTYECRDLLAIVPRPRSTTSAVEDCVWIELVDGSRLVATSFRVKDRTADVQIGGRSVPLEARDIRWVRFHPPAAPLDDQWKDVLTNHHRGDVIVLRRSATALDQLEGAFHDITAETVEFEYDDERISVQRTKLEGLVYFHPTARELPDPVCTVHEIDGSLWQAGSVELRDGQLGIVTTAGSKCAVPWAAVARLDFSTSNVAYLSDLEFELVACDPYIGSRIAPERILQLYAPRRDHGFAGSGLYLAGPGEPQRFEKGLAIHSRSELVFRLAEPCRRLTAVVGIDSRMEGRGDVVLVIDADGQELFRRAISGGDAPLEMDLGLEGIRRLRILVDYGRSFDVGDHLNLCNARIIK